MEQPQALTRPSSPELDAILGQSFKVLDDGFVRVVDYMGNDSSVVQAARVSYGVGTKKVNEDRGLIRYLLRHHHTTPLEMCEIKFHVRVPMDCWRQWIRHRMASVNEYSTRYSEAIDAKQQTLPNEWRSQSTNNKQGSAGYLEHDTGVSLTNREFALHRLATEVYQERLEAGVAREQARKDLPLSTYTEAYWKIDLHNLLHFLRLRMDSHAQKEIRDYATVIGREIVARWVPFVWEAFEDYRLESMALTKLDIEIIQELTKENKKAPVTAALERGLIRQADQEEGFIPTREGKELEAKLQALGLPIPWQ